MKTVRSALGWVAGVALAASLPVDALAAGRSTAYFAPGDAMSTAYLIDWQAKTKVRVVAAQGAQTGRVSDDGTQKTVTLGTPLSQTVETYDECGEPVQQRKETQQIVVRDLAGGITQFVEMGVVVNIGGCQDGVAVPFGAPTDQGVPLKRLAMTDRPTVADLVSGTQMAGFSEEAHLPGETYPAEDVVTLETGSAQFHGSGNVVPAAFDANGWLVFDFPGFQRAYTRVAVDTRTGGESWLMADWAGGQAQRVQERLQVKLAAGAGFGSVSRASRMWEAGLGAKSSNRFFIYLYRDGTGERVNKNVDLDTEVRAPIAAWRFDGLNLLQSRNSGPFEINRTWVPLRNQGPIRWVMESEAISLDGGEPDGWMKPRVNFYIDTGRAVPIAQPGHRRIGHSVE